MLSVLESCLKIETKIATFGICVFLYCPSILSFWICVFVCVFLWGFGGCYDFAISENSGQRLSFDGFNPFDLLEIGFLGFLKGTSRRG